MSTHLTRLNIKDTYQMDSLPHQPEDIDLGVGTYQNLQTPQDPHFPHSPQKASEPEVVDSYPKLKNASGLTTHFQMDEAQKEQKDRETGEVSSPSDRPVFSLGENEEKKVPEKNWLEEFTDNFEKYLERLLSKNPDRSADFTLGTRSSASASPSRKLEIGAAAPIRSATASPSRKWNFLELSSRLRFFKETLVPAFENSEEFYATVEDQINFLLENIHEAEFVSQLLDMKRIVSTSKPLAPPPSPANSEHSGDSEEEKVADIEVSLTHNSVSIDINRPLSFKILTKDDKKTEELAEIMKLFASMTQRTQVPQNPQGRQDPQSASAQEEPDSRI